ncbi:hypothetical protein T4D_1964 [Trichinella pseudospiralis]|uniref:Uncharacterized protein n=1 Tax=Trichinella pseudospiralis TaxID=6337 RepID=A0A0V1G197_TRIPS|nr:hypothetical protein T4D_1964 [Trichinella pseudospiralis]
MVRFVTVERCHLWSTNSPGLEVANLTRLISNKQKPRSSRIGVVHAGGCLSFAVNSFEQNNTERLTGRSAKVVSSSFCHGSCGAQGPKSVGQKYNRLFWPSSSSRRSAFAIVLSTLARVKLAVLVGVQCKEFLPKKEHVPQILPLGLIDNRRPASFFLH